MQFLKVNFANYEPFWNNEFSGTFLAIGTTSSIYAIITVFLGFTVAPFATGNSTDLADLENLDCTVKNCTFGLIEYYQV